MTFFPGHYRSLAGAAGRLRLRTACEAASGRKAQSRYGRLCAVSASWGLRAPSHSLSARTFITLAPSLPIPIGDSTLFLSTTFAANQ